MSAGGSLSEASRGNPRVDRVQASAYRIPTDAPEADGTIAWDSTTMVVVEVSAGGKTGLGYTYADAATAIVVRDTLAPVLLGRDALGIPGAWEAMVRAIRNLGRPGIASMAISAADVAMWDLKARLLDAPLVNVLGAFRDEAPVYGSGGFTSYSVAKLREQLGGWVAAGIPRVKMKIGTHPRDDLDRVRAAREAIGPHAELFVDANGAYDRKFALAQAERFADLDVSWFEEPVSADDLEGLRLLRDRIPSGMEVAAGEYGYDAFYFRNMLESVDVLQADASRCGGITGFLKAAVLAEARCLPISAHCAPSLHVAVACATPNFRHLEYFHDHDRIEHMLFDGAPSPVGGALHPDFSRPGLGLDFKRQDASRYAL